MEMARLAEIFRDNQCWLRNQVSNSLKRKYPTLFDKEYIRDIKRYVGSRNQWWLVLLFVLLMFFVLPQSIFSLEVLNFLEIKEETAKILVDQRTTNIATIISITLVVVGFLINNIAIRETFAYDLLFEDTSLYLLIYLTLGTIGCFVITSTLRDWIPVDLFSRIVISGTYLVLVILLLIGRLFGRIIHFTNSKNIEALLHKKLIQEAKANILYHLIMTYGKIEYNSLMSRLGVKKFDWLADIDFDNIRTIEATDINRNQSHQVKFIHDINIVSLENFIKSKIERNQTGTFYYNEVSLNHIASDNYAYIWDSQTPNNKQEKAQLKKLIILYKNSESAFQSRAVRNHFDQKIEDWSNTSNHKNLGPLLDAYIDLYDLEMQHK